MKKTKQDRYLIVAKQRERTTRRPLPGCYCRASFSLRAHTTRLVFFVSFARFRSSVLATFAGKVYSATDETSFWEMPCICRDFYLAVFFKKLLKVDYMYCSRAYGKTWRLVE